MLIDCGHMHLYFRVQELKKRSITVMCMCVRTIRLLCLSMMYVDQDGIRKNGDSISPEASGAVPVILANLLTSLGHAGGQ